MSRKFGAATLLFAIACCVTAVGQETVADGNSPQPDNCGTLINFCPDTETAFQKAATSDRPVFVVHLSGNFQKDEYT